MQSKQITINYHLYELDELEEWQRLLIKKSVEAQSSSHSPYSKFKVGAAVLLDDDTIVIGSNQENAAYPSGLCAERVAVFSCGANYPTHKIRAIAISASAYKSDIKEPLAPCGACRQSLLEYEHKQGEKFKVLLLGVGGQVVEFCSLEDLLPIPFNCDALQNVS